MTRSTSIPTEQPVIIRGLKITTRIELHPDFIARPRPFAIENNVDLVGDLDWVTDIRKKPDDKYGGERVEHQQANVHLVRHDAIRLFMELDGERSVVRSIELKPSLLLYGEEFHLLSEQDLPRALTTLRDAVAPLLANPGDAAHIVPGLHQDEDPVACWSLVDTEIFLRGVKIGGFHHLSHPSTGPAQGGRPKRIQLGDKRDNCLIRFKDVDIKSVDDGSSLQGVRVRLILKGQKLVHEFTPWSRVDLRNEVRQVVAFPHSAVARVLQAVLSDLEGIYLPVPPEWRSPTKQKAVTHAKVIALLSQLGNLRPEQLQTMSEEIQNPSKSTRKRFKKDLKLELSRLASVPVGKLFQPTRPSAETPDDSWPTELIDSIIASAYLETDQPTRRPTR